MKLIEAKFLPFFLVLIGLVAIISLTAPYNYLLFHILAELFSILIAWVIFLLSWHNRDKFSHGFFLFLGVAFLFIGLIDLVHTLAYKGMPIFIGYDTNLPTQLWIAARYLEAFSLLAAPFFLIRRAKAGVLLGTYAVITCTVLLLIFSREFPDCYIEGSGLTSFKIYSEYVICLLLLLAMYLLSKEKGAFSRAALGYLYAAIILTICSELAFTSYISVYGPANFLGHIFKIVAFAVIYLAIVITGIPWSLETIFHSIARSEKKYSELFENMEEGVAECEMLYDHSKVADYRFIYVNSRYAFMMGLDKADIVGKTGSELYSGISPPPHLDKYEALFDQISSIRFEALYKPEMKYYTIFAFRAGENHFVSVVADITGQRISEGALIRANKQLQLLSQITRHDINNDLSLAYASVDLLKGMVPDNPDIMRYLGYLRDSIDEINKKISFTRNYEQMGTQKPYWHDLSSLIDEIHDSSSRLHSIEIDSSLGSLKIFADMMLPKVFANLIDNSLRHGKKVKKVTISYQITPTGCDIIYEDDGIGVRKDEKDRLFEAGYGSSQGFGLFLIREILLITGIEICEDGDEGKGARFIFHVPNGGYSVG